MAYDSKNKPVHIRFYGHTFKDRRHRYKSPVIDYGTPRNKEKHTGFTGTKSAIQDESSPSEEGERLLQKK